MPVNVALLLLLLLLLAVPLSDADSGTRRMRALPIGDSITQGGRADREEYTYRYPLYFLLRDAGYEIDFIGSRSDGLNPQAAWPDRDGAAFDPHHEGTYGAKTAEVRDRLKDALPDLPPPDIALIHLGTNDQDAEDFGAAIVKPLEEIVLQLRERNPQVVVLFGHLNFNGGAAVKIRPLVEDLAKRLSTEDSPVATVHHYRGWVENPEAEGTDTFDWAHPNPQGQRKMAGRWLEAMRPHLERLQSAQ